MLVGFLEFLGFIYPEPFLLGDRFLKLGMVTLHLFKLGLQPGYLVPFLLELGLVCIVTLLLFGCAEMAESAYKN